jgi:hypothetical protein
MFTYGEVEAELRALLTSVLDKGEWVDTGYDGFTRGEEPPLPTEQEAELAPERFACGET